MLEINSNEITKKSIKLNVLEKSIEDTIKSTTKTTSIVQYKNNLSNLAYVCAEHKVNCYI